MGDPCARIGARHCGRSRSEHRDRPRDSHLGLEERSPQGHPQVDPCERSSRKVCASSTTAPARGVAKHQRDERARPRKGKVPPARVGPRRKARVPRWHRVRKHLFTKAPAAPTDGRDARGPCTCSARRPRIPSRPDACDRPGRPHCRSRQDNTARDVLAPPPPTAPCSSCPVREAPASTRGGLASCPSSKAPRSLPGPCCCGPTRPHGGGQALWMSTSYVRGRPTSAQLRLTW